ncbi:putative tRNA methyltransferase [Lyophyllum shimeji]|uniref:tRNA (guanine(26)-N(2))-dimethyltransferase n=1 Tax=Lyophyllum shimeji TaxID=47721 RepID=A0A9P3PF98_LYOSH|nr:putative tRNA methyltransferase [Lyophyllum shimeji]
MSEASNIIVPDGFTLHTENTSHILLESNEAFLNPVQEFNRDTSVACIRVWSEELNRAKEARWRQNQEKKARKAKEGAAKKRKVETEEAQPPEEPSAAEAAPRDAGAPSGDAKPEGKPPEPYRFVLLEALSATGLRSIRYAKEIPLLKYVIANDLSPSATAAMKRNVDINDLGPTPESSPSATPHPGKVRINEGDACTLMYSHREEKNRVDVVDLDPYGTAAPFIDAAVQSVKDGGLLCVTCTDLSVLATTNYPEKCFSNYGGVPVKAEYCHEAALRIVLHTLSTSASRYGRYIEPLVSLSIDFYVRIFVRVKTAPLEVKKALTKTSAYYICSTCQSFYEQPLGRVIEKTQAAGNTNYLFKIQNGPPVTDKCPECDSALHMAGPMWSGPLHDKDFVTKVLEHLEANEDKYGTAVRMKGMLTVAQEELDVPFYFTPAKIASFFHCTTPSLEDIASALLHAGHKISRSHACAGSLKTTATRQDVHSIFRSWIKLHPVKMENVSETSPARRLLQKEPSFVANFQKHPDTVTPSGKVKLVRYQENPTSHWGPGTKAVGGSKRKRGKDDM